MDETRIRFATPIDAEQLARLRLALRTHGQANLETDEVFLNRCQSWMRTALSQPFWRCWVGEKSGELVAAIWLQLIEKIPNPISEAEQLGYITNFFVAESARGCGLGTKLLTEALRFCRESDVHSVVLWPTDRSRSLYQRHGFGVAEHLFELTLGDEVDR